jgi:hypothetical protein
MLPVSSIEDLLTEKRFLFQNKNVTFLIFSGVIVKRDASSDKKEWIKGKEVLKYFFFLELVVEMN